jgi:hypothetical protein
MSLHVLLFLFQPFHYFSRTIQRQQIMSTNCKNCTTQFTGNYCPNCGQSAATHKINHHFIWHDIQHELLHFDKGIIHTGKKLFTIPGHFIRDYIDGKRINEFKPISLLLLLATFQGLLTYSFHVNTIDTIGTTNEADGITIKEINEWVAQHFAWIILFTVPVRALTTFITFYKQGYNIYEHIIMAAYLASQRLFLHLAVFPIDLMLNNTALLQVFIKFNFFIDIGLSVWAHTQFFNKLSKPKTILLSLLSWLLFITILTICLAITLSILNIK